MRRCAFGWFLVAAHAVLAGCVSQECIPQGMLTQFCRFFLSRRVAAIPLQVRRDHYGSASDSIFGYDGQRYSRGSREARLLISKW